MPKIQTWSEIEDKYTDTLLLGNGASMAIDPCFSYRSLKEAAAAAGLITSNIQSVFDYLKTQDFELVMNIISHTYHVNQALCVPDNVTLQAYNEVKTALVGAVRGKHTSFEEASVHLKPIATFMKRFHTVLSLNYDLIVYWAMMESKSQFGNWFKDCFVNGTLDIDWRRMRQPFGASGSTLVFYPHGNLALATSISGFESKMARQSDLASLLACVLQRWESGEDFPLFVSEGDTEQKKRAILRSHYLSTVYNEVMQSPSLGESCAVYGWSANDNDAHILQRSCQPSTRYLAFSVYRGQRSQSEVDAECAITEAKVRQKNQRIKTEFYWSDSADCWLNAVPEVASKSA
jgi:hypothetical protein